jgi:hypothetical protein
MLIFAQDKARAHKKVVENCSKFSFEKKFYRDNNIEEIINYFADIEYVLYISAKNGYSDTVTYSIEKYNADINVKNGADSKNRINRRF